MSWPLVWLLLLVIASRSHASARAVRITAPRLKSLATRVRLIEPWPRESDYPSHLTWRSSALSWTAEYLAVAGVILSSLREMLHSFS